MSDYQIVGESGVTFTTPIQVRVSFESGKNMKIIYANSKNGVKNNLK